MKSKLCFILICVVLLLTLVSCQYANDSKDPHDNDTSDSKITVEEDISYDEKVDGVQSYTDPETNEPDLSYPSDAPYNSAVITVFSEKAKSYKVIDDMDEIDNVISFFESLEKGAIDSDKKGGMTIAVVINTPELKTRIYFINNDKISFSGLYSVDKSAYSDFLAYYDELPYSEHITKWTENT